MSTPSEKSQRYYEQFTLMIAMTMGAFIATVSSSILYLVFPAFLSILGGFAVTGVSAYFVGGWYWDRYKKGQQNLQ